MESQKKKALFIINPMAGVDRVKALEEAISKNLDSQKFDYEIAYTQYAKHGIEIARQAAKESVDVVVAVGGDGSVNDVVHGLYGSETLLGILPKGSGNGLARSLKIPLKTDVAIKALNDLNITPIDVAQANETLFVSNAGVGFDTTVTEDFKHNKRRGFLTYTAIVLKNLTKYKPKKWQLQTTDGSWESKSFMLTVANAKQLGYGFQIAPEADLQDGLLELVDIRPFPILLGAGLTLKAFLGKTHQSRYVTTRRIREIEISHPELKIFQVDGESFQCNGKVSIKVLTQRLKVITPLL